MTSYYSVKFGESVFLFHSLNDAKVMARSLGDKFNKPSSEYLFGQILATDIPILRQRVNDVFLPEKILNEDY